MRASPWEANNQAGLGHRQICKILLSALAGFTINALYNHITSDLTLSCYEGKRPSGKGRARHKKG